MKARARPTVCKRCGREYSLAVESPADPNATTTATALAAAALTLACYAVMAVHTAAAAGN
jgi:hypothetical protein